MKYVSKSLTETATIAKDFAASLEQKETALVVELGGDLGGGKTAFIQALARALGVQETVTSPTFVLQKVYKLDPSIASGFSHLIHIDAYRLDSATELVHLGWNEIVADPRNLVCIEWPLRVHELIPAGSIRVECEFIDETTHGYEIKA